MSVCGLSESQHAVTHSVCWPVGLSVWGCVGIGLSKRRSVVGRRVGLSVVSVGGSVCGLLVSRYAVHPRVGMLSIRGSVCCPSEGRYAVHPRVSMLSTRGSVRGPLGHPSVGLLVWVSISQYISQSYTRLSVRRCRSVGTRKLYWALVGLETLFVEASVWETIGGSEGVSGSISESGGTSQPVSRRSTLRCTYLGSWNLRSEPQSVVSASLVAFSVPSSTHIGVLVRGASVGETQSVGATACRNIRPSAICPSIR